MIREAKEQDFPEVYELYLSMIKRLIELNPERFEIKKDQEKTFKKQFEDYLSNSRKCIYVYEEKGEVLGYGSARIDKSESFEKYSEHGWVSEISVKAKAQNKGIGGEIIEKIMDFFKGKGITTVYFFVETNNLQSIRAWEKKGFNKEMIVFFKMLK